MVLLLKFFKVHPPSNNKNSFIYVYISFKSQLSYKRVGLSRLYCIQRTQTGGHITFAGDYFQRRINLGRR